MTRKMWFLALTLSAVALRSAGGQAPSDSVAAWTAALQGGTLPQRATAMSALARFAGPSLPASTQQAVVAELQRVSQALFSGADVPGASDLGGETFGEYFVDLAATAGTFRTADADRALILAVGVSGGVQRRVARLGDAAIPQLADMIARGYQPGDALETMALAWFWADSTGAPLSDQSRQTILAALIAAQTGSLELKSGLVGALRDIGDGAFLPLAQEISRAAAAANDLDFDVGYLDESVIPILSAASARLSIGALAGRTRRLVVSLCGEATTGVRRGACQSMAEQLDNAIRELAAGRSGPARNLLQAVLDRARAAQTDGAISDAEYSLIIGGVQQVLARLP